MNEKWLKRCATMDENACNAFVASVKSCGWHVAPASKNADMFQHIDYVLTKDGRKVSVELKSCKRGVESGRFLVEILNVRGNLGWLFGKADLIAFETEGGFLMVNRSALYRMVRDIFGFYASKSGVAFDARTKVMDTPENTNAPNIYRRHDRPREAVTFIPASVVFACVEDTFLKI